MGRRSSYGMPLPVREKRTAQIKAHVPTSLREQYEKFIAEADATMTLSDYVYGVLEEHAAMRIAKQTISRSRTTS